MDYTVAAVDEALKLLFLLAHAPGLGLTELAKRSVITKARAFRLLTTLEQRDLVRRRDWRALIHYGAIFFLLEKLGAVVGTTNLHIYAHMRGQSLEDFLKTRNTQVLYSVAAQK